jgi:N-acyl homoserine lactone hydrolase
MNVGPLTCAKNLLVAFAPGTVDAPTTSVVIEHPEHGVVLWDTGINEAVADPERGDEYWGPGLRTAFGTQAFTREHVVDKQLEKLGFRTSDVRYVVYSHLHLDHAGGMFISLTQCMSFSATRFVMRCGRTHGRARCTARTNTATFAS